MIPGYVYVCLDKYGNAYVPPRLLAKVGGIEQLLKKLKESGYDCVAETKVVNEREFGSQKSNKSMDTIIVMKERTDK